MKNLLTTALLLMATLNTWAQDILFFHDGRELQTKVTEVGANEVKYHRFDNLDGPVFVSPKAELFMIKYKNGTKEMIQATAPAATQVAPTPVQQAPQTAPSSNGLTTAPASRQTSTANALIRQENKEKHDYYLRKAKNRVRGGVALTVIGGIFSVAGAGMTIFGVTQNATKDYTANEVFIPIGASVLAVGIGMLGGGIGCFKGAKKYRNKARELNGGQAFIAPSIIRFNGHQGVGASHAFGAKLQYQF